MRVVLSVLAVAGLWACGGSPTPAPPPGEEAPAAVDSVSEERVVVLRAGPLHLEPDESSPGVTEVPAGGLLKAIPDSAGGEAWVRVATWDDRRGWIPAERLVPSRLWAHYGRALGGVSPVFLRPAYPVDARRWAVEAPVGSPGFTSASTAWLLGDSATAVRVAAIDSVENVCGGELHRVGILDARAAGRPGPLLDAGRIAAPSGSRPDASWVAVGPFEPDAALASMAAAAATDLVAGAGVPASTDWATLGPDAVWVALAWPEENEGLGISQRAAALVFRRAGSGWERVSWIAPEPSTAVIPTAAWRPVAALSTGGSEHPTILLLEAREYEGAHLDIWVERGGGYQRIYEGYYWGC